ncbi:hypothetical protein T01_6569, partial [Trichinella spiralis]
LRHSLRYSLKANVFLKNSLRRSHEANVFFKIAEGVAQGQIFFKNCLRRCRGRSLGANCSKS